MRRTTLLLAMTTGLILSGCASAPKGLDNIRDQASREAVSTSRSGTTLITEAESLSRDAQAQETYRFAPVLTKEAASSLKEARMLQNKGRADDQVRVKALAASATYQRALEHTLMARETLAPSLAHMEVLNRINSRTYYPSDVAHVESKFANIIATLETTAAPASTAQSQRELLLEMHAVEVSTIGFLQLQKVRNQMKNLKDANAATLIPRSYKTAAKTLASAEGLVQKTPRAEAEIASLREQAEVSAAHAQVILSMVNETLDANSDNAEALVLRTERWLYNIAGALKYPDIRHLPMDEQSRQLADGIEELLQR